ncbi:hypothetical protein F4680DRAFT_469445 [Xylaria scruposa]|nr:hypothetical protein F4680DRAFT_469445 [Xylaria scruposa]
MANESRANIIEDHPIRIGFNNFRNLFNTICREKSLQCTPHALDQLDKDELLELGRTLLQTREIQSIAEQLPAKTGRGTLELDFAAATDNPDDTNFWDQVHRAVCSLEQTSSSPACSYRLTTDSALKLKRGAFYVDIDDFDEKFFGTVTGLKEASKYVFDKCMEGSYPLFSAEGWRGWPADEQEPDILAWFKIRIPKLEAFARPCYSAPTFRRELLAQPKTPVEGSTGERSIDIGFVDCNFTPHPKAKTRARYHWSHVLVPGELKCGIFLQSQAKMNLATHVREAFSSQDTRRFVLGFSLCRSFMRVWVFDRLGGIASESFDINRNGLQFVNTVLGFLWMNEEALGFDPTVIKENDKRAHRDGPQVPLVIKDSWQNPEHNEEGIVLRQATEAKVANVARYYYHETVQVHGTDDDVRNNVRRGLDTSNATNYWSAMSVSLPPPSAIGPYSSRGSSNSSRKRSCSQIDAPLPSSKRYLPSVPLKDTGDDELSNRVHRRVILRDYGKPTYEASIRGHESLHKLGVLHRDISINNLLINEDTYDSSLASFSIDRHLAIRTRRDGSSGAEGIAGTKPFVAIGALRGELHTYMHDLESFLWVLYWICIHYYKEEGKTKCRVVRGFDLWNFCDPNQLAIFKSGIARGTDNRSIAFANANFHEYWQPLVPHMNKLQRAVFPNRGWEGEEDPGLYTRMREVLEAARKDPEVSAER